MRQLYYTLVILLRGKGSNIVKLVSLSLGLLVGVLLFSQIVYELNYDTCYQEHEKLMMFGTRNVSKQGEAGSWEYDTFRPAAAAVAESFPELVECATPVFFWDNPDLYLNIQDHEKLKDTKVLYGDTLFFQTMGIELLSGDPQQLASRNNAFLSQSQARVMFGSEDPIGKTFSMNKRFEITVRGVYKDIPGNVSFPHNIIISLPTIEGYYGQGTWNSNDIYMIYVRLHRAEDRETINRRLTEVIGNYTNVKDRWDGGSMECQLLAATDFYLQSPDSMRRLIILFVLGFSIFFVSGMNYVLAAIATIGWRAKMVGVHKCCGADAKHVASLFLWETGLLMLAAIVCSLLMVNLAQDLIEDMLGISSIGELFTWQTLWVPILTVVLLFCVAGVLPGRMFARIPVTQVFRRYTDNKQGWKRGLLFVQFAGVAFILGVLITSIWQYHNLTTRYVGFDTDHLAVGEMKSGFGKTMEEALDRFQKIEDDLRRQPFVEDVGRSNNNLLTHYYTRPIPVDGGNRHIHTHYQYVSKDFPQIVGMTLVKGHWPEQEGEAVIGEKLAEELNWGDQLIGHEIPNYASDAIAQTGTARVAGVVRDIRNLGFYGGQTNVVFVYGLEFCGTYHVRLKEPQHENLLRLNDYVHQTYSDTGLSFLHYAEVRQKQNMNVFRFRNTVYMTSGCILLIVLMGLMGYVANETQRRSKEIAVRKVNGASVSNVLGLLSMGILKVAIGAVAIGLVGAWYVSGIWMEQFSDCTLLSAWWFVALAVCLLILIVCVVVLKAWHIANENPVKSIKSE